MRPTRHWQAHGRTIYWLAVPIEAPSTIEPTPECPFEDDSPDDDGLEDEEEEDRKTTAFTVNSTHSGPGTPVKPSGTSSTASVGPTTPTTTTPTRTMTPASGVPANRLGQGHLSMLRADSARVSPALRVGGNRRSSRATDDRDCLQSSSPLVSTGSTVIQAAGTNTGPHTSAWNSGHGETGHTPIAAGLPGTVPRTSEPGACSDGVASTTATPDTGCGLGVTGTPATVLSDARRRPTVLPQLRLPGDASHPSSSKSSAVPFRLGLGLGLGSGGAPAGAATGTGGTTVPSATHPLHRDGSLSTRKSSIASGGESVGSRLSMTRGPHSTSQSHGGYVHVGSGLSGSAHNGSVVGAASGPLRLHVLFVDDEPVNRNVAKRMLQRLGCTTVELSDGDEVEAALVQSGQLFEGSDGPTATRSESAFDLLLTSRCCQRRGRGLIED